MDPTTFELMEEHVRDIYRAVTGDELPDEFGLEPEPATSGPGSSISVDELTMRFLDLESAARRIPKVAERVPPFSFSPPVDIMANDREVLIEVAAPGVQRKDVTVVCDGKNVSISGARGGEREGPRANHFLHAELPRGPFHRMVPLPFPVDTNPTVQVEHGLIRVCLPRLDSHASSTEPEQPTTEHEPTEHEPTTTVGMEQDNADTKSNQ